MDKIKVLLIDKPLNILNMSSYLRDEGLFLICGALNSSDKVKSYKPNENPDYIVMNPYILSESDIRSMMSYANYNQIPVILFSGDDPAHTEFAYHTRITYTGTVSKDSRAYMRLVNAMRPRTGGTSSLSKIRIFLVDDAALMKIVISNILSTDKMFHLVGTAANGMDGIKKLKDKEVDVVLLDLEMPVMTGFEFLQKVDKKFKIIVLSSIAEENKAELMALGADAIINKPSGAISLDMAEKNGGELISTIKHVYKGL